MNLKRLLSHLHLLVRTPCAFEWTILGAAMLAWAVLCIVGVDAGGVR